MLRNRSIAALLAMVLFAAPLPARASASVSAVPRSEATRPTRAFEPLSSPSAAGRFQEIAYEQAYSTSAAASQIDQAIILLTAAKSLNYGATGIERLLLKLAIRQTEKDYSDHIILWLQHYVSESADRAVVMDAIGYLLDRRNSREQRKELLERLVTKIGNRNAAIDSELATLLGFLMIEKGDSEAAKFYLIQAYTKNKHNKVAFAKLGELVPREIGPATYLEHLRLIVRENPLNIDAAANFAQYAERLQLYDIAAPSYQYSAELFRYLYPSQPLPPQIYLPWAICCYNAEGGQETCLQIAENVRKRGQFDTWRPSPAEPLPRPAVRKRPGGFSGRPSKEPSSCSRRGRLRRLRERRIPPLRNRRDNSTPNRLPGSTVSPTPARPRRWTGPTGRIPSSRTRPRPGHCWRMPWQSTTSLSGPSRC